LPACENMKTLRRILTGNLQRLAILQHLPRYQEYLAFGDEVCAALSFQDYYTIKFGGQPKDLDEDLLKGIVGGVKEDGIMFKRSLLSYDSLDHKESEIAPLSFLDEHKVEEKAEEEPHLDSQERVERHDTERIDSIHVPRYGGYEPHPVEGPLMVQVVDGNALMGDIFQGLVDSDRDASLIFQNGYSTNVWDLGSDDTSRVSA